MSRKYARENAFKVVFTDIKEENSLNWEELASEEKDGEIWSGKAPARRTENISKMCAPALRSMPPRSTKRSENTFAAGRSTVSTACALPRSESQFTR